MYLNFKGKHDVYLEVAERYKEYIKLGIIKVGEKLPSVRTVASELGVNPNTVAKAYSVLESEGFAKALPKKGVFVIYNEDDSNSEKKLLYVLKEQGVSRETLIKWIEEVYADDRD